MKNDESGVPGSDVVLCGSGRECTRLRTRKRTPKRGPSVMARSTGFEPAFFAPLRSVMDVCHWHTSPYRVGGVVESRMARISKGIVLVIDKFGEGKKGFTKVFKNISEVDSGRSRKK